MCGSRELGTIEYRLFLFAPPNSGQTAPQLIYKSSLQLNSKDNMAFCSKENLLQYEAGSLIKRIKCFDKSTSTHGMVMVNASISSSAPTVEQPATVGLNWILLFALVSK